MVYFGAILSSYIAGKGVTDVEKEGGQVASHVRETSGELQGGENIALPRFREIKTEQNLARQT